MNGRRALPLIVVVDFLAAVVLVQQAILARTTIAEAKTPAIPTAGVYAVSIEWAPGSDDDVDLYVQDPAGEICYFGNKTAGPLHLELDDLGVSGTLRASGARGERVVLRAAVPGEYVVSTHLYSGASPARVLVRLWSLTGSDRVLVERRVLLPSQGEERTPFRFRLSRTGTLAGTSRLPKRLVGALPS